MSQILLCSKSCWFVNLITFIDCRTLMTYDFLKSNPVSIWYCHFKVYWQAPPSNSGCVTLRAMVAENENVWYEDGGPLTARICEDVQQPDDVTPQLNYECSVCDEAKYEV